MSHCVAHHVAQGSPEGDPPGPVTRSYTTSTPPPPRYGRVHITYRWRQCLHSEANNQTGNNKIEGPGRHIPPTSLLQHHKVIIWLHQDQVHIQPLPLRSSSSARASSRPSSPPVPVSSHSVAISGAASGCIDLRTSKLVFSDIKYNTISILYREVMRSTSIFEGIT